MTDIVIPGKPLGRNLNHDPRSLAYPFKASSVVLVNTEHKSRIGVLDQGDLGSCTGNATVDALGSDPFYDTLSATQKASLNEKLAVQIYSAATKLDNEPGNYPPDDTGSDGLSAAKAAQQAGLISGYTHALSLNDALRALVITPVIIGINWYEGFDNPDNSGKISVSGSVRGGHEIALWKLDVDNKLVWLKNSWGSSWGVNGTAAFSWDDFSRLLSEDGDCTIFTPLTTAPPTPIPPVVDQNDQNLWSSLSEWAAKHHTGDNKKAAAALNSWATAKGYK